MIFNYISMSQMVAVGSSHLLCFPPIMKRVKDRCVKDDSEEQTTSVLSKASVITFITFPLLGKASDYRA